MGHASARSHAKPPAGRLPLPLVIFAGLVLLIAAILFAALPVHAQVDSQASAKGVEVDRIILRVNNQILTLNEYEKRKSAAVSRILANTNLSPGIRQEQISTLGKQLVKDAYDEMLMLSRADQAGIVISDQQVASMIQQIRDQQGLSTDESFRQALASAGMTIEDLRDQYRRDMRLRDLVSREVQERIDISDDALRAFYREHPERFQVPERRRLEEVIVLASSGLDAGQLAQVAADIRAAAVGGTALAEASESFRAQGLVSDVNDLGWLNPDELGEALRTVAFAAEPGGYSEPVEARGGLHILHVIEAEAGSVRAFSEVQDELRAMVRNQGYGREMRAYMADLEARSFVRENLPPEAIGFRALADSADAEPDALDLFRAPVLPAKAPEEKN